MGQGDYFLLPHFLYMQISPQQKFVISHQLASAFDEGTYYVQAVVRNAITDTVIDTINLTHKGNQRYTADWYPPADPTGRGLEITMTVSVYTDSGYSTLSTVYATSHETHIIQERYNTSMLMGSGGSDVSYKKIQDIVRDELEKQDFSEIKLAIQSVLSGFSDFKEKVDRTITKKIDVEVNVSEIKKEMRALLDAVQSIKIPEQKEVNFKPILSSLENINTSLTQLKDVYRNLSKEIMTSVESMAGKVSSVLGRTVVIEKDGSRENEQEETRIPFTKRFKIQAK